MTQFNAPTYDVERPTGQCAFTGRTLEPGEAYTATLVEADTPDAPLGLKRLDVAMDAWNNGQRPDHLFSYWKTVVPEPNQKKSIFVDNEVLMNLLRRLSDADNPQRLAFRFILALILMRKKLLRYDRTEMRPATVQTDDGLTDTVEQEWWLLTPKLDLAKGPLGRWNVDESIEVLNPQLDEQRTQQVTEQLNEILNAEL